MVYYNGHECPLFYFSILYKLMIIQVAIRLKASTAEKYQQNGVRQDDEKKKETTFL